MNLAIAPFVRVQIFGLVVALLARLGLPAELAGAWTDALTVVAMLILSTGYGWFAAWRDSKSKLIDRAAEVARSDKQAANALIKTVDSLPQVVGVAVVPEVARAVESRTVTTIAELASAVTAGRK